MNPYKLNKFLFILLPLLFLSGYYNDLVIKYFYNAETLLGVSYIFILLLVLFILQQRDRLRSLREENSHLEDQKWERISAYDKLLEKKTLKTTPQKPKTKSKRQMNKRR
jgi:hypothetical protein